MPEKSQQERDEVWGRRGNVKVSYTLSNFSFVKNSNEQVYNVAQETKESNLLML